MKASERDLADQACAALQAGRLTPSSFRRSLTRVEAHTRDAWLDLVLGLEPPPPDGPSLPRGCVPYLPSSVEVLLRASDLVGLGPEDVFVDVGSGAGRALAAIHLLTGARVVGLEIQPELVQSSRELMARLGITNYEIAQGDCLELIGLIPQAAVLLLYCPFAFDKLNRFLDRLEERARSSELRLCCVDVPPISRSWLERAEVKAGDLTIYRSKLHR